MDADTKALRTVDKLLSQCRTSIDPTVPVQIVQAFVCVALNEGKTLAELADKLGANNSTTSRHILDLGEYNRRKEPGYMLVEGKVNPEDLRTKRYYLSPKGKLLAKTLANIVVEG